VTLDRHHIILYICLFAAIAAGASIWHERIVDLERAKAEISAQAQLASQFADQQKQSADREKQRDAAAAEQLATMQAAVAKLKTPQQIAAWIPQQPGFGSLQLQAPAPTPANPSPEATASVPEAQLPELEQTIEKCGECSVKLSNAQQDLADRQEQLRLAGEQLSAVSRERDAALKAAKGGGFFTRAKRDLKWAAIGGALAYLLVRGGVAK
jgi:hypothetical protein